MCPTRHWFLPQPMRSLGLERVDQDTCSPSKCYVWLMLLCVSWDTHGCSVLSFSWRQKTCQQIFLSHIIHRARAEATAPAFCELSSLSLMEMHAHTFETPLASDISAKKEGENCWEVELLERAQMDASAEWLRGLLYQLPLFSYSPPLSPGFCAAFEVEAFAF